MEEQDVPAAPLNQGADGRAAARADDQIAFPVPHPAAFADNGRVGIDQPGGRDESHLAAISAAARWRSGRPVR
jgi:hypothetical protein